MKNRIVVAVVLATIVVSCTFAAPDFSLLESSESLEVDNSIFESGSGVCSWYGAEGEIPQGWPTACGEGFDRFALASAHPSLPCGTRIRVTSKATGRSVEVRVNDRGPFSPGRILDLTYEAFGRIDDRDKGIIECTFTTI